ncbi:MULTISPECIES: hypothetical protein [unclassified Stenotrophomonas]|uniref:hypothetical protein n=1 Tax=unclassified Stenotrophomonas TaxID=196198 RepID=UPI0025DF0E30|nr:MULTISPECIES: hypothetical protein [unclassified Stenotrophomonas]
MKTMFKIGSIALMLLSFGAAAQSGNGLSYRAGDPFLFCTKGQDVRAPCWKPMPNYTGQFMFMPYCKPINPYGKSWTQDDTKSFQEYLTICPQAEDSGRWSGGGRPEYSPFKH